MLLVAYKFRIINESSIIMKYLSGSTNALCINVYFIWY